MDANGGASEATLVGCQQYCNVKGRKAAASAPSSAMTTRTTAPQRRGVSDNREQQSRKIRCRAFNAFAVSLVDNGGDAPYRLGEEQGLHRNAQNHGRKDNYIGDLEIDEDEDVALVKFYLDRLRLFLGIATGSSDGQSTFSASVGAPWTIICVVLHSRCCLSETRFGP